MIRSQQDRLICHLATGKRINPMQALKLWGVFRLGARIYDLRKAGHRIEGELVRRNGKSFSEYWLVRS